MSFSGRPAPAQAGGPNVVPIRPGALSALSLLPEEPRRSGDERESVELTTNERDAFREIARALGARLPSQREERPAGPPIETSAAPLSAPPAARDLIDVAEPPSPAPPDRAREAPIERAAESARHNACALLDRLPIGAMVLRGGEPLYLNQTMLDLVGYRDLAEFRAADGLAHMFRGRDAQTLAEASEGGAMPLVTAGGELIAVDGHVQSVQWDDAPATLIALRRSRDAEYQAEVRALEREARAHEATARDLTAVLEVGGGRHDRARPRGPHRLHEPPGRSAFRLRPERSGGRKLPHVVRAAKPERGGGPLRTGQAGQGNRRAPARARNSSAATGAASRSRCSSRWRASPRRTRRPGIARWFGT